MTNGWHVTAQNIKEWTKSNRRQAQDTLPLLIRKLIYASVKPSLLSIPAGDSISSSGWDGILKVNEGNAFVPEGFSVWEFGTKQSVNKKADEDFEKRTENPMGVNKKSTTFVFVTSCAWLNKDNWVQGRNDGSQWGQVKGLNADDLETWLEQCPAVHRWFSRLIGKRSDGDKDIEQAWGSWSLATRPECNLDLVLAGRQDQAEELANELRAEPSVIRVWGESEDEAYAFALAVVNQHLEFSVRFLEATESSTWDVLLDSQQPLILIPRFDNPSSLGLATKRGHWVILPLSSKQRGGRQVGITIVKADRDQQISALVAMGLEKETAEDVVRSCRGYLNPIRRHPALAPDDYRKPGWATSEHSDLLLAALLAGAWDSNNSKDCDSVANLACISFVELEKQLHQLAIEDDPPVRLVENIWQIVSRQDAWNMLSIFINASVLERFGREAVDVLQELDPSFELPSKDRWKASIYYTNKTNRHSDILRRGIAEMLAMLASYADKDCQIISASSVQDQVSLWISQLLIENISGQGWYSLKSVLPSLGEAAPDIFLEAVETGIQGDNPPLMELFIDEGIMGGCPYANLLFALESISWNQDHLARIVRILAKLSSLDYSSSYSNHPSESLVLIFQGWLPQTKVSLDDRLQIIDLLLHLEPEAGWKLLLDLLPKKSGISTRIYRPEYRDWADGWNPSVTQYEYFQHIKAIVDLILEHVDENSDERWPEFIEKMPQLPKKCFDIAVSQLRAKNIGDFSDIDETVNKLRQIVGHHRKFADAKWALPKDAVDQLDEILIRFTPEDVIKRNQFLFDEYLPSLTDPTIPSDHKHRQKLIGQMRRNALEEIWDAQQAPGIEHLALNAKYPASLGNTLGISSFTNEIECLVLSWLGNDNNSLDQTSRSYISARYAQDYNWIWIIKDQYIGCWTDEIWAAFCLSLPFNKAVFDFIETLPGGVANHFWQNETYYYLQKDEEEHASWVLEQLLAHKRPFAAIDASAHYLIGGKAAFNGDLLARILELAIIEPTDHENIKLDGYEIIEILKTIQSSGDIDHERLGRLEWIYLPFFYHNNINPVTLMKEVNENPNFFVHLICLVFEPNPPIEAEFSNLSPELKRQHEEWAWYLLERIDQLPGQNDQGIDTSRLQEWIEAAKQESSLRNRGSIGGYHIGKLLSHSPIGNDGVWPHEAVRNVIESFESQDIESGIESGTYGQRGVVPKSLREGGKQDQERAGKFKQQAEEIRYTYPRTAAMLRRIADSYGRNGVREDIRVELRDY